VSVGGCHLARPEVLDGGPQRGRGIRQTAQSGIRHGDGTAFTAASHGNELTGALRQTIQLIPMPDVRHGLRFRNRCHQVFAQEPQRNQTWEAKSSYNRTSSAVLVICCLIGTCV
jgi:hypothetical protein